MPGLVEQSNPRKRGASKQILIGFLAKLANELFRRNRKRAVDDKQLALLSSHVIMRPSGSTMKPTPGNARLPCGLMQLFQRVRCKVKSRLALVDNRCIIDIAHDFEQVEKNKEKPCKQHVCKV